MTFRGKIVVMVILLALFQLQVQGHMDMTYEQTIFSFVYINLFYKIVTPRKVKGFLVQILIQSFDLDLNSL